MDFKDYYKILGVNKSATTDEIKSAYRKLAKQFHPDKTKGDVAAEEKFKEIGEAYEVLSDTEKRRKYDNLGANYRRFQKSGGRAEDFNWQDWFATGRSQGRKKYQTVSDFFSQGGGLSDFFEKIFGGGFNAGDGFAQSSGFDRTPQRGADYSAEVELSLEEAYKGCTKLLQVNSDKIEVHFKPGIMDNKTLLISGKGLHGKSGGARGNLFIKVKVKPHTALERKGDDLHLQANIDLYKMVLGGKVKLNTFSGPVEINIPPESQNGKTLRLSGLGMPNYDNPEQRGSLYITLIAELPQKLNKKEKELFKQLKELKEQKSTQTVT